VAPLLLALDPALLELPPLPPLDVPPLELEALLPPPDPLPLPAPLDPPALDPPLLPVPLLPWLPSAPPPAEASAVMPIPLNEAPPQWAAKAIDTDAANKASFVRTHTSPANLTAA
jgi:hypothetical protein